MIMTSIYHSDYCFAVHCSLFVFVVNWYLVTLVSIVRCTAVFVGYCYQSGWVCLNVKCWRFDYVVSRVVP